MKKDLHVCWLINEWRPSLEKHIIAWQKAGYHCILWHSDQISNIDVPDLELRSAKNIVNGSIVEKVYNYESKYGMYVVCSELLRYLVLYIHGGHYVDLDNLPGKTVPPESSTLLFDRPSKSTTLHKDLEIRYIKSNIGNEIILSLLREAVKNENNFIKNGGYFKSSGLTTPYRTGCAMAFKVVKNECLRLNIDIETLLISNVTNIDTEENNRLHHHERPLMNLYSIKTLTEEVIRRDIETYAAENREI